MSKSISILGYTKESTPEAIYLRDFSWDCDWYWGGGYIGNRKLHTHFDSCFLDTVDIRGHNLGRFCTPWDKEEGYAVVTNGCSVWEPIEFFLDGSPDHVKKNWWRIKDLFKQFYTYRKAAECFHHGGHCTSEMRCAEEIVPDMAQVLNDHIFKVIIPEVYKAFEVEDAKERLEKLEASYMKGRLCTQ
jgi:hypothetical protein